MTQNKAKRLIKIGKYFLIVLFVVFATIILIQSININNLKDKKYNLETELNNKVVQTNNIENKIEDIENNFNEYSENKLREDGYKKENEDFFSGK